MTDRSEQLREAELRRLSRVKQVPVPLTDAISPALVNFFKQSVQKRQTKLGKIAETWGALVPELLAEHCSLESFHRGTLVVLVDSASHLYELKQLLLAGLQQQILLACAGTGLRKIALKPGRWYEGDADRPKLRFD